jgi:hypothetical protein
VVDDQTDSKEAAMASDKQAEAYQRAWDQLQRAAQALDQAGDLIGEAHAILDRFCAARDQDNWDQAFPWRISELQQARALCSEVAAHLKRIATEGGH